jgi:protein tyrosine/serine phosphatase
VKLARVTERLYRSDQPSLDELKTLADLGIDTIVNLRREHQDLVVAQRQRASELGLRFFNFPFYGIFGAPTGFLDAILETITAPEHGTVLVHCKNGIDRTSLVVGLHRVLFEGWPVEATWQHEFVTYGHDPVNPPSPWKSAWKLWFYRNVRRTFLRHIRRSRFAARSSTPPQKA